MIGRAVDHAWFGLALWLGRLLRAGRYSTTRIVRHGAVLEVRKRRRFYAPALLSVGDGLMRLLGTGVRILPQREWQDNERRLYETLHGVSVRVESGGTLVLPFLTGHTLASLLEDHGTAPASRASAMRLAAAALADLHARGLTHGDAMAENVIVDLDAGVARWFDFETVHDARRALTWRRADDVRALVATCLLRSAPDDRSAALGLLLDAYGDEAISTPLAECFGTVRRRALVFHLAQAGLSFESFREAGRLLRLRAGS